AENAVAAKTCATAIVRASERPPRASVEMVIPIPASWAVGGSASASATFVRGASAEAPRWLAVLAGIRTVIGFLPAGDRLLNEEQSAAPANDSRTCPTRPE